MIELHSHCSRRLSSDWRCLLLTCKLVPFILAIAHSLRYTRFLHECTTNSHLLYILAHYDFNQTLQFHSLFRARLDWLGPRFLRSNFNFHLPYSRHRSQRPPIPPIEMAFDIVALLQRTGIISITPCQHGQHHHLPTLQWRVIFDL